MDKYKISILFLILILLSIRSFAYMGGSIPSPAFSSDVNLGLGRDCSAVQVAEKQFLTAAHCSSENSPISDGKNIFIYNTSEDGSVKTTLNTTIIKVYFHPKWKGTESGNLGGDLAIVEISDVASFGLAKISRTPAKTGDSIFVGGYGCPGGKKDIEVPTYYLSGAIKSVLRTQNSMITVGLKDLDHQKLSFACAGDSGAPAYRKDKKTNQYEVVGINSFVTALPFDFTFDPVSSALTGVRSDGPFELWISGLTFSSGEDNLSTEKWLRGLLPAQSFSL